MKQWLIDTAKLSYKTVVVMGTLLVFALTVYGIFQTPAEKVFDLVIPGLDGLTAGLDEIVDGVRVIRDAAEKCLQSETCFK